jgi:methyl-accepting chemotaxis protein
MSKNLLILERSSEVLTFKKDTEGSYVLEGIFGEMGVKNRNGRVYDESEYLPQVESLREKIKSSKLMGELDHPQNFDISLKNVSHVIEDIYYDKDSRQVRGKIRLLNTDAGRQAKALVDDGIPLHISSRAAGVVESNGKVKIKKLFTYDLVADPGFENAQLNRVNESYGFHNDDLISIYEIDSPIPGSDQQNVNDTYSNTNENNSNNMDGLLKVDDFNIYSKHIAEQLNSIKSQMESFKAVKEDNGSNSDLVEYVDKMRTRINEMFSYMKTVVDTVNGVVENVEGLREHNNHIVENIKDLKGYVDHVAENADNTILYVEDVANKTNDILEYNMEVAEHVDNIAQFGDQLAKGINELAEYSEYLKNNIETVGQYSDFTAENVKKIKMKLASINEEDRAKEIEKEIVIMGEPKQHAEEEGEEVVGETQKTNESFDNDSFKSEIAGKLDLLIESAQKQTADFNGDLHFLRFLNSNERNKYFALNENVQHKIIEKAKSVTYTSQMDVNRIIESVIVPVDNTPLFIKGMPQEYRDNWENASGAKKNQIIAESKGYSLNTDYQISNFWSTRDFRENSMSIEKINESSNIEETIEKGVQSSYLTWFEQELAKKFRK